MKVRIVSNILHISSYTFIYLYIRQYTFIYLQIASYIYFKISNIQNMRANMRPKNGHNSGPRAFPRVGFFLKAFYHVSKGFGTLNGDQF